MLVACLLAGAAVLAEGAPKQRTPRQKRTRGNSKLKRQKATKRNSPVTEAAAAAAKAEAAANTKTFLKAKGKRLLIPVNVDVLLIGFEGTCCGSIRTSQRPRCRNAAELLCLHPVTPQPLHIVKPCN